MKLKLLVLATGFLATSVSFAHAPNQSSGTIPLTSETDKVSYTIGADLGKNFKKQEIDININALVQGLKDSQAGDNLALTKEEMQSTLQSFQKKLIERRAAKFKEVSEKNKKEGDDFLAKNKTEPGVVTTASGLQYKVLTKGNGAKPTPNDTVKVEYTGRLINGTVFDSSEKAGKPATFKVTEVIPGWTEALKLMPQGSTWEIYVPSELAYGARGVGEPIGPNQTLIFKVHLLTVEKNTGSSQTKVTSRVNKS